MIGLTAKNLIHTYRNQNLEEKPPEVELDPNLDTETLAEELSQRPETGVSTLIGKLASEVSERFGEPERIDPSYYGFEWWIYDGEEHPYLQIGVKNGQVVTLVATSPETDVSPFRIGASLETIYREITMQNEVELEYNGSFYRFELYEADINSRPLIPLGDIFAQLYFDNFSGKLLFIRFMDKETLLIQRPYDLTYWGTLIEPPELTEEEWKRADSASARQIFDLTNVIREREELPALKWDEKTAEVAYFHSLDMYETETFSHESEKYGDLADRLESREVVYEMAGENIASQYIDSIAVVAGWLNSKEHRDTLLNEEFTHLGVGVYKKYYTQNFIKRSWDY